jgi:GNAT superfamily N-acetyltransferase
MTTLPPPVIELPRQRGTVSVRLGGLDDDLDALNEGNRLWWGKQFVADRIATTPPEDPWMILVGEVDGRPAGYAFILGKGVQAGGYAMADLFVPSAARGRGVGRALSDALVAATAAYGLPGVTTSAPDDDEVTIETAERWGFRVAGRHRESVLDLESMDTSVAAAAVTAAESRGFRLAPLADGTDATDAEWQQAYDLVAETFLQAPDAEGASDVMPFSIFRGFFPDASYVFHGWRGDRLVGSTSLMVREKDDALNTLFTGVHESARGHGLATALKAAHALYMRDRGHRRIYTQNMEGNEPILAANDRLGFRPDSGYVDLARAVDKG